MCACSLRLGDVSSNSEESSLVQFLWAGRSPAQAVADTLVPCGWGSNHTAESHHLPVGQICSTVRPLPASVAHSVPEPCVHPCHAHSHLTHTGAVRCRAHCALTGLRCQTRFECGRPRDEGSCFLCVLGGSPWSRAG